MDTDTIVRSDTTLRDFLVDITNRPIQDSFTVSMDGVRCAAFQVVVGHDSKTTSGGAVLSIAPEAEVDAEDTPPVAYILDPDLLTRQSLTIVSGGLQTITLLSTTSQVKDLVEAIEDAIQERQSHRTIMFPVCVIQADGTSSTLGVRIDDISH